MYFLFNYRLQNILNKFFRLRFVFTIKITFLFIQRAKIATGTKTADTGIGSNVNSAKLQYSVLKSFSLT